VVEELGHWYEQGFREFSMWDDNFTLVSSRVYEICDLIEDKRWDDINITVPNGVRPDRVTREMLSRMREVGFSMLSFGVESGSDKVLRNLEKGETVETMEKAIANACDLGYEVYLYFLIGSPGETWDDFEKSLTLAQRYPVAESRFYTLIPFPGTELFKWVKDNNYFLSPPSEYLNKASHFIANPCFATPEMPAQERIKAFEIGWKVTQEQRKRYRNLQLKRFGLVGKLVTAITLSSFYQRLFKPIWFRRIFIEPVKKYMFG